MKPKLKMAKGERFGSLVFLGATKIIGEGRSRRWLGEFLCDCGKSVFIRMDCVKRGNNKSCGCKSPNKDYKIKQQSYGENYAYYVLNSKTFKRAKARNIEYTINADTIKTQFQKQGGICVYTGESLDLPENFLSLVNTSIDRIDSNLGYLPDNIQLVSKVVNFMKQSLSHDDFIAICAKITKYAHATV